MGVYSLLDLALLLVLVAVIIIFILFLIFFATVETEKFLFVLTTIVVSVGVLSIAITAGIYIDKFIKKCVNLHKIERYRENRKVKL